MAKTKTYHSVGSTFLVTAVEIENSTGEPCLKKYIQQDITNAHKKMIVQTQMLCVNNKHKIRK